MKKKFIIYILFPLLILAVGMSACTEDTILADAGKLPDETTMGTIGIGCVAIRPSPEKQLLN